MKHYINNFLTNLIATITSGASGVLITVGTWAGIFIHWIGILTVLGAFVVMLMSAYKSYSQ